MDANAHINVSPSPTAGSTGRSTGMTYTMLA
jgi:hypothetical protein